LPSIQTRRCWPNCASASRLPPGAPSSASGSSRARSRPHRPPARPPHLRPLYLAWLAGYGTWERDEDAFDHDEENDLEPPVPAGLGALTAPQRALADFLRLDTGLLTIAAQASPPPPAETKDDPRKLAKWIRDLPVGDKDTFLCRVAHGHGAQVQMELRRRFRGDLGPTSDSRPRRTVAELLGHLRCRGFDVNPEFRAG